MAAESRNEAEQNPVESLIDDLIHDILTSAGRPAKPATHTPVGALIESALASPSRMSAFERLLVAHTMASAVAEALAPALAEALAPEIMKVLEQQIAGKPAKPGERASSQTAERARK